MKRSKLYPAIRTLFAKTQSSVTLETTDGQSVELTMEHDEKEPPKLFISFGDVHEQIPSFWMLADSRDIRSAFRKTRLQVEIYRRKQSKHGREDSRSCPK